MNMFLILVKFEKMILINTLISLLSFSYFSGFSQSGSSPSTVVNPVVIAPPNCNNKIEIDLFGSTTTSDDFLSTGEYDFIDGRIRSTQLSSFTVKLKAAKMRFASLAVEEDFVDIDRDPDYTNSKSVTYPEIDIEIKKQNEWYYFILHVDPSEASSFSKDSIISIEVYNKQDDKKVIAKKNVEIIVETLVLYRGLSDRPSTEQPTRHIDARNGKAYPIGWVTDGHCSVPSHVTGKNNSIYISWTLNPHQALRFIYQHSIGTGILLKYKISELQTIANDTYFIHNRERLVIGPVLNAQVKIVESSKNLK